MNYYVYVIKSSEGFHYTGMTGKLSERLVQHNSKSLSIWTKRGNNWKIIYSEVCHSKSEALKREKYLKSGTGRDFLKNNIAEY